MNHASMQAAPRSLAAADPMVEEAARRAFRSIAEDFPGGLAKRRPDDAPQMLARVRELGFAGVLPDPGATEGWPEAAAIVRAQAFHAAPIDMAALALLDDETMAAQAPSSYHARLRATEAPPIEPTRANALALGRALQIGASLQAAVDLAARYSQDRRQFGRPLAKFQAIQHALAIAAEEVAAANVITDLAVAAAAAEGASSSRCQTLLDACALVLGEATRVVVDASHQIHGAIGFTREYALHRYTLQTLAWRDDLQRLRGGELRTAERLGARLSAQGRLWPALTELMDNTTGSP